MNIYDENIQYLGAHNPGLLSFLLATPDRRCRTEPARNGSTTLVYTWNDSPFYIHSRFNPEADSEKILANKNTRADHLVVFGLGLGFHLERLFQVKSKMARILLVEPDPEIVKHSLKTFAWFRACKRKDFFFFIGDDLIRLDPVIHGYINMITLEQMEYIELPSEVRFREAYFREARRIIDNEMASHIYDIKTRLTESVMLPRNILKNLPEILNNRPSASLKDIFRGAPGFIVSAGPSLDKNMLYLKKIKNRGVIIAVDTALKSLLKRGIQPHFTAVGDPTYKNYLHLQGAAEGLEWFLAAEAGVSHQIFRDFRGKIFTLSVGKPIVRMIEAHSEPLGELEAWGSVISIALALAVYMGLNPIVFTGQDFAYTDDRNHCRGTSWEESITESTRDLDAVQRQERQSIGGDRRIARSVDIFGRETQTSERLELYKNYLARLTAQFPGRTFINATEGGIFREIPHMPLADVLRRHILDRPPVSVEALSQAAPMNKKKNIENLRRFFQDKKNFFTDYRDKLNKIAAELGAATSWEPENMIPLLNEAESVREGLYTQEENGVILEMWSLAPIYYFLKEYKRLEQAPMDQRYFRLYVEAYQRYFRNIAPLVDDIIEVFGETRENLHAIRI